MSSESAIDMVILPRTQDIGGFEVRRVLPHRERRLVGPFIFWDQMGRGEFQIGKGIDVRPHPHIGLSTVTYLFEGSLDHKDSLGNDLRIVPGDVNLMTAGSGIVHSERTGQDVRAAPSVLYGIQSWLAQPLTHEEGKPAFEHVSAQDLPEFDEAGARGRVILGDFCGMKSPVKTQWETLYVDIELRAGARLKVSKAAEERAIYVVDGHLAVGEGDFAKEQMLILQPGRDLDVKATSNARFMALGGATMDSQRFIYWNFVASTKERIEVAKSDWRDGRFPVVPGDDQEFIPLPD